MGVHGWVAKLCAGRGPMPKGCDPCGKPCQSENSRTRWCGTKCKQANTRRLEGQKRAALAMQLATAQDTIRSLTAELEVLRGFLVEGIYNTWFKAKNGNYEGRFWSL